MVSLLPTHRITIIIILTISITVIITITIVQLGISFHHCVCVSRRHITHPAPVSVVLLAVPRARLLKLMAQRVLRLCPPPNPSVFIDSQRRGLIRRARRAGLLCWRFAALARPPPPKTHNKNSSQLMAHRNDLRSAGDFSVINSVSFCTGKELPELSPRCTVHRHCAC